MDNAIIEQSPFLPGTNVQYAWDSTSLGWLKTCPRLYQYHMIEGWTGRVESIHLRFGIEYHQALQDYDISRAGGIPHDDAVFDVVKALMERTYPWDFDMETLPKSAQLKSRENLVRAVIWYLDAFKDDPCETYIKADGLPAVELSFRFELDWGPAKAVVPTWNAKDGPMPEGYRSTSDPHNQPYLLCGHLDKVVRFNDELFVMDHKTTTSTPGSYYFDQYHPDNQMTLYTLAGKVVLGAPIRGVIVDAMQIAVGFSRPVRGMTYRTEDQLDEWLQDLEYWLNQAESYAEANYWPQNDKACGMYGGCRFREICSKSPSVREQFLKSNFEKGDRWNPLKARV